ncbi:MAG: hypothetical protein ACKOTZ_10270 [Chloroflexota bacterium]
MLRRPGPARSGLLVLVALLALVGCGGGAGTPTAAPATGALVTYTRDWPDGYREEMTIAADGKMLMRHGEYLERLVLPEADLAAVRAALTETIPAGDLTVSPDRTIVLADGTTIAHAQPDPGSLTELLDRLMDTHKL